VDEDDGEAVTLVDIVELVVADAAVGIVRRRPRSVRLSSMPPRTFDSCQPVVIR